MVTTAAQRTCRHKWVIAESLMPEVWWCIFCDTYLDVRDTFNEIWTEEYAWHSHLEGPEQECELGQAE